MRQLFALQLSTGGLYVVSSGAADIDLQAVNLQYLLKSFDGAIVRPSIATTGMRIEGNNIDLASNIAQQLAKCFRVFYGIVDPAQQHIFEGNSFSPRNRQLAAALHQLLQRVLAIDRHQLTTQLIGGGMKRNRQ